MKKIITVNSQATSGRPLFYFNIYLSLLMQCVTAQLLHSRSLSGVVATIIFLLFFQIPWYPCYGGFKIQ